MAISLIVVVASCLCAATSILSTISAASERIVFSGAIVEPTCSVPSVEINLLAAAAPSTHAQAWRWVCAQPGHAAEVYALTAERLSSSVHDRMLKYFDAYVMASGPLAMHPVLLTQTYE
ncbi:hypothetical protein [Dyella sp. S184]|uniref:hypothetical protein n=1 Tax=Dyella sp. S184 TaxID=1641862 RepID=UPI00131D6A94|nr:hypothetical protein [Dyella sp. S184]